MPNWCYNVVTVSHEDPAMLDKVESALKEEKLFETFAPIGEWDYVTASATWGTKWDVSGVFTRVSENESVLSFDSAWSPPVPFYAILESLGFYVRAMYYEPGMAFCGIYEDGFDDEYNLGDMSADEVEFTIPSDLNEQFAISEQMADWEAENEEEENE